MIRWQPEVISPRSSEQNASEASASMEAAAVSVLLCAIISPMSLMPPVVVAVCHIFYISGSKVIFCKTVVAVGDTVAQK